MRAWPIISARTRIVGDGGAMLCWAGAGASGGSRRGQGARLAIPGSATGGDGDHNNTDVCCQSPAVFSASRLRQRLRLSSPIFTMRAELIGHFEACMTEIYLHI